MSDANVRVKQELADAARAQQQLMTGRTPTTASASLSGDTLVLTLHGALTPAEQALRQRPDGSSQVEEFHRRLFDTASGTIRQEIKRITGREVRESALEIDSGTGAVIHSFNCGTIVQVYLLDSEEKPLPMADEPAESDDDDGIRTKPSDGDTP